MNTSTNGLPFPASAEAAFEDRAGDAASAGSVPTGPLTDVNFLTRLANEMFAQLPGCVPDTAPAPLASGAKAAGGSPEFLPPWHQDLRPVDAFRPLDVPLVGAPGVVNSSFKPAAHEAPFSVPGEAELRALLSPRLSQAAFPQPLIFSGPDAPSYARLPGLGMGPAVQPKSGSPIPTEAAASTHYYFLDESRRPSAGAIPTAPQPGYDVHAVRRDFPILNQEVNGHPLIWLDNAATTQKPQAVIDRLMHFYSYENSNVHRGAHELAARSTDAYEDAREKVRGFLGASSADEIVFVRGATEAVNLVAQSWGRQNIGKDDEIVITWLEHHANIVPWQQLCTETGAVLKVVPVDDHGQVRLDAYEKLLGPRTKLVSFTEVSNALGTVTPAKQMAEMAHRYGARVLIDGAQAVSHMPVNVQELGADWYVLSGHKVFAPTGIGVLYGRKELLELDAALAGRRQHDPGRDLRAHRIS